MSVLPAGLVASLRDGIHAASFTPGAHVVGRVGAEVEFLVLDEATRFPIPLQGSRALIERVREQARRSGWTEFRGYDGTPRFDLSGRATISFEPGGQLEISTIVCESPSALVALLRRVVVPLRGALRDDGVELVAIGIDPLNDARRIPLQLHVDRYERMTRYFERIGPYGIRMMRQTAALQVSLDRGAQPVERWRLLNDLAPYLVAIFANSPHYLGVETGHRSFRAKCWRMLDPSRTGVAAVTEDPAQAYTEFALGANDIASSLRDGTAQPFAVSLEKGASPAQWEAHLTTMFPEVRPRGHFEVRSCDAVDPAYYAAPIILLAGIAYDRHSSNEAGLLAAESRALLRTAGEVALRDGAIARTARDLFELGLAGARRLGPRYVSGADLEIAGQFYADYTARDRSPADDRLIKRPRNALNAIVRLPD